MVCSRARTKKITRKLPAFCRLARLCQILGQTANFPQEVQHSKTMVAARGAKFAQTLAAVIVVATCFCGVITYYCETEDLHSPYDKCPGSERQATNKSPLPPLADTNFGYLKTPLAHNAPRIHSKRLQTRHPVFGPSLSLPGYNLDAMSGLQLYLGHMQRHASPCCFLPVPAPRP